MDKTHLGVAGGLAASTRVRRVCYAHAQADGGSEGGGRRTRLERRVRVYLASKPLIIDERDICPWTKWPPPQIALVFRAVQLEPQLEGVRWQGNEGRSTGRWNRGATL